MKRILTALSTLVLFTSIITSCSNDKRLPQIDIVVEDEIPWESKIPCQFNYIIDNEKIKCDAEIKCRGGYSSRYNKHSFALKLQKPMDLCGLPASDSWILNANYVDKTFMRHKLCYDLFRQMGAHNVAARCAYARVSLNTKPNGLYVVMQKLDENTLGIDRNDTMAVIFKDPPLFNVVQPENGPEENNYYGQKWPKKKKNDRTWQIEAFRDFLVNASDDEFAANLGSWIDIKNVIDWHLLLLLSEGGDGFLKNFYLYKTDSKTPYRIAVWDCDHSFGREGDGEKNWFERGVEWERSILFSRLMKTDFYRNALKNRWKELRDNGIFTIGNIYGMIDENDRQVRLGTAENFSIWPYDSPDYYDAATYEEEVALLKEFVSTNLERLDLYFLNL
ncbi:MAG: CotH kinase family protein [Bacteroidales bacterium]|nr:CotH kinase family protein [Bacteroidales bacterium]